MGLRLVFYNPNSAGGCFDYQLELIESYSKHPEVESIKVLMPSNVKVKNPHILPILLPDHAPTAFKLGKKAWFLNRVTRNPLIARNYLKNTAESSFFIFNDFDQLSALYWAPAFKKLKPKHRFGVFLHDPDRDNYPPNKTVSSLSMKAIMDITDVAFYHEYLPVKPYYQSSPTEYVKVPHGIFTPVSPNDTVLASLNFEKSRGFKLAGITGNIRYEKRYDLAIQALPSFPDLKLIIAGKEANSSVDLSTLKALADELGVSDRVIWIHRFLTDHELASVIQACDLILLNYSKSFTSQSGILNLVAPYKKQLIISGGESSLAELARRYKLGILTEPDSLESLINALKLAYQEGFQEPDWEQYIAFASWEENASIAIRAMLKKIEKN